MSDSERSPLLSAAASKNSDNREHEEPFEGTPLLSSSAATPRYDGENDDAHVGDAASVASHATDTIPAAHARAEAKSIRWPSVIAMIVLAAFALAVIILAFIVPAAIEEYAKQATVIEPTNLSLVSITPNGVRARVQANFRVDAQRVESDHVRRVGRAVSWLAGQLGAEETKINVYLPDFNNVLLGSAGVPPLRVTILDGHNNEVDFVADLIPGDADGIRTLANEWLKGRLSEVRMVGQADVQLSAGVAGFIPLGTHSIVESLTFEGQSLYRSFAALYFGEKSLV